MLRDPLTRLDSGFFATDVDSAVLLEQFKCIQSSGSRGIFDISTLDIEASCSVEVSILYIYTYILYICLCVGKENSSPPCHGQVILPSGETTPFFKGAP